MGLTPFINMAIEEAKKGRGKTAPNPIVGAVVVRDGKVLATGYHHAAGGPHAEIEALNNLTSPTLAHGATLYVTLEPCSTTGKTPPCTQAIIDAGITRVIYGATDPNPAHQGRAKKILEEAGITVTSGLEARQCEELNRFWNHRMKTSMPWIIAKCGMSLDGRISSPPGRRWITSQASRHDAMLLRAQVDAILVGGETVRTDNPSLTVRDLAPERVPPEQPWRIIWTRCAENIPKQSHLLSDTHASRTFFLENISLREGLRNLATQGINSVLIEGGGNTLGEAFARDLVDEVRFYIAPLILGGGTPAVSTPIMMPPVDLVETTYRQLDHDLVLSGLVKK